MRCNHVGHNVLDEGSEGLVWHRPPPVKNGPHNIQKIFKIFKIFRIWQIVCWCQHPLAGEECGVTHQSQMLEPPLTRWHDWNEVNKYGGSRPRDSLSWDTNLFVCNITTNIRTPHVCVFQVAGCLLKLAITDYRWDWWKPLFPCSLLRQTDNANVTSRGVLFRLEKKNTGKTNLTSLLCSK